VGAGGWGKNHVRNYAAIPEADLRYICDRHEGIRESMAARYPSVDVVSDLPIVRALEGGSASLAQGGARIKLSGGR